MCVCVCVCMCVCRINKQIYLHTHKCIVNKLANRSYFLEVLGRAVPLSLYCSTLP